MHNKKNINFLGIDWGAKRVGLALGGSEAKIATPHKTVSGIEDIEKVVKEEEIDELVLGQPLALRNAADAGTAKPFNDFVSALNNRFGLPLHLVDERLTSKAADSLPGDNKSKAGRDAVAAMLILQSYLDTLHE